MVHTNKKIPAISYQDLRVVLSVRHGVPIAM